MQCVKMDGHFFGDEPLMIVGLCIEYKQCVENYFKNILVLNQVYIVISAVGLIRETVLEELN